jgi:hypothetical protein
LLCPPIVKPASDEVVCSAAVLAKAFGPEFRGRTESESPTTTRQGTATGIMLGTAAYMSPERAVVRHY